MPKGLKAARRAVFLDPSLAEADAALAMASLMGAWNKAEAEREFLQTLELNPGYIQARDWYALFYLQLRVGRLDEGVAPARQALDCDPLSSYANTIFGHACCIAGRYADGLQACERAVELDSESFVALWAPKLPCMSADGSRMPFVPAKQPYDVRSSPWGHGELRRDLRRSAEASRCRSAIRGTGGSGTTILMSHRLGSLWQLSGGIGERSDLPRPRGL